MSKKSRIAIVKNKDKFPIFIRHETNYFKFISPHSHVLVCNQSEGAHILNCRVLEGKETADYKTYLSCTIEWKIKLEIHTVNAGLVLPLEF